MENHKLQLVENTYNAEDAKEVLFSLINDKLKFLKLQMLSKTERFGSCPENLEHRLEGLKAEKEKLQDLFKQYDGQDDIRFDVDCLINIKVAKSVESAD